VTEAITNEDLRSEVISAHGGSAWSGTTALSASVKIGGPFWEFKGQRELFGREIVSLSTHRERISLTNGDGRRFEFDNGENVVRLLDAEGQILDHLPSPRESFEGYSTASTWSRLQAAYFISYALWHYLTEPFLFDYPGVEAEEIEPWDEGGETWRRLQVRYPTSIATHSHLETYYFGADFLQRRMDYSPAINHGADIAHYTHEYRRFGAFLFPTQRRVYPRLPDNSADMTVARITIDVAAITVE